MAPNALPIAIPTSPLSPYSTSPRSPAPRAFTPNSSRRLSESGQHSPSLPFGSFVGSFENSLLAGRLSAQPSHPVHFISSIGVLGDSSTSDKLRCPPHLNLPFDAFFYSSESSGTNERGSPYVGTIDLESHYFQLLSNWAVTPSFDDVSSPPTPSHMSPIPSSIPKFPGYRVPRKGQIQIVVKYPNSSTGAIKLFLCKYDLTGLDRGGKGGKTFVRQKSYSVESDGNRLRYAIHLQFCSPPTTSPPVDLPGFRTSSPASPKVHKSSPRYYLHKNIRVVFASNAVNLAEKLLVVSEGPEGDGGTKEGFAPYLGPGENWDMVRQKAKVRIQGLRSEIDGPKTGNVATKRSGGIDVDIPPNISTPPSLSTLSLSSFSYLPLSATSSLRSSPRDSPSPLPRFPIYPPTAPTDLANSTFARQLSRAVSPAPAPSGLSSSRPSSRVGGSTEKQPDGSTARAEDGVARAMEIDLVVEEGEQSEMKRERLIGR